MTDQLLRHRPPTDSSVADWPWLIVFGHELRRLVRRTGFYTQRLAFTLLLFVVIWFVHNWRFGNNDGGSASVSIAQSSAFGFEVISGVLVALYCCVVAITPFLVAGVIAEERQKRTLELLLITPLPAWSILAGKVAARCVQPLTLLLAAVPMLAFTQFWGGIDGPTILVHLLTTLLAIVNIASTSAALVIRTNSVRAMLAGLVGVYSALLLVACIVAYWTFQSWPLAVLVNIPWVYGSFDHVDIWGNWLLWVLLTHGLLALIAAAYALTNFERQMRRQLDAPRRRDATLPSPQPQPRPRLRLRHQAPPGISASDPPNHPPRPTAAVALSFCWPAIGDNPLWWKEHYYESGLDRRVMWRRQLANAAGVLCLPMGMCVLSTLAVEPGQMLRTSPMLVAFNVIFFVLVLLLAATRLAGSVASERSRGTLTELLLLPCERRELLRAKFWGGLLALRFALPVPLVTAAICWTFAVAMSGLDAGSALLLVGMFLTHTAFAASVGLWWSVHASQPGSAVRLTLSSLLITQLPLAMLGLLSARFAGSEWVQAVLAGLSMPVAWGYATFCPLGVAPTEQIGRGQVNLSLPPISTVPENVFALSGLVSIVLYTTLSVALLRSADRAFAIETDRVGA